MKKQFEMPVVNINKFHIEKIITTSGSVAGNNAVNMQNAMEKDNFTVTAKSLKDSGFVF